MVNELVILKINVFVDESFIVLVILSFIMNDIIMYSLKIIRGGTRV